MSIKKIEIQDSSGNIYYPHTDASVVKTASGSNVEIELGIKLDKSSGVKNLLTNQEGFYLDGTVGPLIQQKFDQVNTNLAPIGTTFSKSQSTADINANSWQDITGVSLTLPAGVYLISAFASLDNAPRTVTIRFSNNTDKRQSIPGESGLMISGSMTQNVKFESETTIYLSAYVSATQTALKNIILEATRTK